MDRCYAKLTQKSRVTSNFLDKVPIFGYTGVDKYTYPPDFMNPLIRLSVSEAAKMFGVSQRTIRRAIQDQEVTYVVVQGRYKINFESLLRWSQRTTTVRNKRDDKGIGQYVDQWKINNKLFSPNPKTVKDHET